MFNGDAKSLTRSASDKRGGVYYSPRVEDLLGHSPDYLYSHPLLWSESIHPQDQARVAKAIQDSGEGKSFSVEYRLRDAKACWHWVHDRSMERRTENGETLIEGLVTDITERKHSEEALPRESQRSKMLLQNASDGIHILDSDGKVLEVNNAFCRMLGYQREELIGANVTLWDARWSPEELKQKLQELLDTSDISTFETRHCRKDGSLCDVEITGQALELDGKRVLFNSSRDISERKSAEDILKESEFFLTESQRIASIGSYKLDVFSGDWKSSAVLDKIFGIDKDYLRNVQGWQDLVHPKDTQMMGQYFSKEVLGMRKPFNKEYRIVRKSDGETRWVSGMGELASGPDCKVVSMIGTIQDITERKATEEKIKDYVDQLELSTETTLKAVALMVEQRDPYTAGHERRVGELAAAIGTEMGLPEVTVKGLRLTGYVHDIGKISVPAELLSKPRKLSSLELQLVQTHAQTGYDILKDAKFPWPLAEVILQHHERLDGNGYPRGLKGDEVIIEARIMAVADVVEAMQSHRPYRAGLGIDAALDEIEKNSGKLYDPQVVTACLRLFREKNYTIPA